MHLDLNAHEGPEDFALPVEVRVKQGMALLDEKHGPGWVWRIDVDKLELSNTCRCVLGQVFGDYYAGCDILAIEEEDGDCATLGFALDDAESAHLSWRDRCTESAAWAALTTAWRLAILARRLELGQ